LRDQAFKALCDLFNHRAELPKSVEHRGSPASGAQAGQAPLVGCIRLFGGSLESLPRDRSSVVQVRKDVPKKVVPKKVYKPALLVLLAWYLRPLFASAKLA